MTVTLFTYANVDNIPVTGAGGLFTCQLFVCAAVAGESFGSSDLGIKINGTATGSMDAANVWTKTSTWAGRVPPTVPPGMDDLYFRKHSSAIAAAFTYQAYRVSTSTDVGSPITVTWVGDAPACPDVRATPAPVLTATQLYNPAAGLDDVQLDWTETFSADSRFTTVQYDIIKDGTRIPVDLWDTPSAPLTLSYLDVGVAMPDGGTYQIHAFEPCLDQDGVYSNTVTISGPEIGADVTGRAAWGVLAR